MSKNKKYSQDKSINKFLVGSFFQFDVYDPLGEQPVTTNELSGHKNPVTRVLLKGKRKLLHQIANTRKLKWRSQIRIEFRSSSAGYDRFAEIVWFGFLNQVEEKYQETIEQIFDASNMSHYVMTHVNAEIIGLSNIKDSDFSISKEDAA